MSRGASDLAGLLTVMGEAHELDEPEPFTPLVLNRVADSLGREYATYYELDVTTGQVASTPELVRRRGSDMGPSISASHPSTSHGT